MLESLTNDLTRSPTPDFRLKIAAHDITHNIAPRLISLVLTDNRGYAADNLKLTLNDADGLLQLPERGEIIQLALGWKGFGLTDKGTFTVDEISHSGAPDIVKITANSANFRGSINKAREQSWHDVTLETIAKTIAKRNSLEATVNSALAPLTVEHIEQSQESDISFVTRLAHLYGGEVTIKAGKLLLLKAGSALAPDGQCLRPAIIKRSEGDTHLFTIADRDAFPRVVAKWTDTSTPQKQEKQIVVQRKAQSGSSDDKHVEYMSGAADNTTTLKQSFARREMAVQAAKAEWERLQRATASFSVVLASAREKLSPDTPVTLQGFKSTIDAHSWTITTLTHNLTSSGFTSKVDLELDPVGITYEVMDS